MHRFIFLLFISLTLLLANAAKADNRDLAREHYLQGTKDFDLGLYDDAIREYMAAYQAKDDPALLYNLGQAHRAAQHTAEALHFYKRYLAKVPDARNGDEVRAKIDELQKLLDQQSKAQSMPPSGVAPLGAAPTASPAPAPAPPTPAVETAPSPVLVAAATPPPPTPVYKKWWLWTTVGVVAVGVGLGVGLGLSLGGSSSSFNANLGSTGPRSH